MGGLVSLPPSFRFGQSLALLTTRPSVETAAASRTHFAASHPREATHHDTVDRYLYLWPATPPTPPTPSTNTMAFMQTTLKSGWITDLVLPHPPEGQTAATVLEAGLALALRMCSDPHLMCRLNPLVQSVAPLAPSDPKAVDAALLAEEFAVDLAADYARGPFDHFAVTDKLHVLPGYTTELTYYSAIRATADGMEALTNPGSGVRIYGRFSVKVADGGDAKALDAANSKGWVLNLLETNELHCNVLLSWYIKGSTDKSHRTAHSRFKEEWVKGMAALGFPS